MKVTIPRNALAQALGIVKNAAGKTLPILANVRIETLEKSLKLTCTDLDTVLTTLVEADIKAKGDTTVRVALLAELVRSFDSEETVRLELTKQKLTVSAGKSKYDLGVLSPEEFPGPIPMKEAETFPLGQGQLRQLLHSTDYPVHTASKERLTLHGTYLATNGHVTVAATDGRRLATATATPDTELPETTAIIPANAVAELLRLLDPAEDSPKVTVTVASNAIRFRFGDTTLTSKRIEGEFPNYQSIIPKLDPSTAVTIARADLLTVLRRVRLVADKCVLEFEGQMLTVTGRATDKDAAGQAEESLLIPRCPKPIKVAFNTHYLIEALEAVPDDELLFFGASDQPGIFRTADGHWLAMTAAMRDGDEKPAAKPEPKPATK